MVKGFKEFISESKEEKSEAGPKVGQKYKAVRVRTQEGIKKRDVTVVSVYKKDREALVRTDAGGDAVVSFDDLKKVNERFEEWGKKPGFIELAKSRIKGLLGGETRASRRKANLGFGEENHHHTLDQIMSAVLRGKADLNFNEKEQVAGGWVEIGGRARRLLIDSWRGVIEYDELGELDLPREQAESLYRIAHSAAHGQADDLD